MSELIRKLQAGEVSANGRTILRVPEPLDIEKYMLEAGYGEAYNYAVLWHVDEVIKHFFPLPTTTPTAMTAANDVIQRIFVPVYFSLSVVVLFNEEIPTVWMWGEFGMLNWL